LTNEQGLENKDQSPIPLLIAGIIGAPFGLKGFVKVKSLSGEINHLLKLKSVILRRDNIEHRLAVEECIAAQPGLVMRFAGYNSPETAKALNGARLLIERKDAAPLHPGEFYIEDLKGLSVFADGKEIGSITDIVEGGGGDLAEIHIKN
jgi:16S rRNA processing protein RimM